MLFITCTAYSTTYRWLPHDYLVPGASKLLILVYIHYTVCYRNICSHCLLTQFITSLYSRGRRHGKCQKGQKWIREDVILCDAVILDFSGLPEISIAKTKNLMKTLLLVHIEPR